jgi:hypothetical protein
MKNKAIQPFLLLALIGLAQGNAQAQPSGKGLSDNDRMISGYAQRMLSEGRQLFRFDTVRKRHEVPDQFSGIRTF